MGRELIFCMFNDISKRYEVSIQSRLAIYNYNDLVMASGLHEISKTEGCYSQLIICTRDPLWVANTYGPPEVGAVLCSVALSHAGGENGASSAIIERAGCDEALSGMGGASLTNEVPGVM